MVGIEAQRERRRRILKAAKIVINGGASVIDCTARNISSGGAALEVPSTAGIPREFTLQIHGEPVRTCAVAWKKSGKIGVRFT